MILDYYSKTEMKILKAKYTSLNSLLLLLLELELFFALFPSQVEWRGSYAFFLECRREHERYEGRDYNEKASITSRRKGKEGSR